MALVGGFAEPHTALAAFEDAAIGTAGARLGACQAHRPTAVRAGRQERSVVGTPPRQVCCQHRRALHLSNDRPKFKHPFETFLWWIRWKSSAAGASCGHLKRSISGKGLNELDTDEARVGPDDLALALDPAVLIEQQEKSRRQSHDRARYGEARAAVRNIPHHTADRLFSRSGNDLRVAPHTQTRVLALVLHRSPLEGPRRASSHRTINRTDPEMFAFRLRHTGALSRVRRTEILVIACDLSHVAARCRVRDTRRLRTMQRCRPSLHCAARPRRLSTQARADAFFAAGWRRQTAWRACNRRRAGWFRRSTAGLWCRTS